MLQTVIDVIEGNLGFLEKMVADVPAERMCHQPPGLPNHPAWQVGHLTVVRSGMARMLGASADVPEAWQALFGPGSTPSSDTTKYPAKDELLATLRRAHRVVVDAFKAADPAKLAAPHGVERLNALGPTLGHVVVTALTAHDGLHVGQLSDWRRVMGLPRVRW